MTVKQLRMLLGKYPDDYDVTVFLEVDSMPNVEHEIGAVSYNRPKKNVVNIIIA